MTSFFVLHEGWIWSRSVESGLCDCQKHWHISVEGAQFGSGLCGERLVLCSLTLSDFCGCIFSPPYPCRRQLFHTVFWLKPPKNINRKYMHIYIYIWINKYALECTLQRNKEEFKDVLIWYCLSNLTQKVVLEHVLFMLQFFNLRILKPFNTTWFVSWHICDWAFSLRLWESAHWHKSKAALYT